MFVGHIDGTFEFGVEDGRCLPSQVLRHLCLQKLKKLRHHSYCCPPHDLQVFPCTVRYLFP